MLNKSMIPVCLKMLAVVAISSYASLAQAALVVTNGSFETPEVGVGGNTPFDPGFSAGGWTNWAGSPDENKRAFILDQATDPSYPTAQDGDQMLQLDHRGKPALVYQFLGTTDEVSDITLSAWFAARDLNVANGIPASMTFSLLLLTGTPDSFEVLATSGPLTHSPVKTWVQHSVTAFGVAAGTPVYAGLQANYYMDDPVVLTVVDDVQVSTVVPEPGTVGLLALGVATIACGRRRR